MSREWKPGDVALIRVGTGEWEFGIAAAKGGDWWCQHGSTGHREVEARPLVVIDPEDAEQVERLRCAFWNGKNADTPGMQAALRSLIAPPKPEVYEHLATERYCGCKVMLTALCGKLWEPQDRSQVTVVGRCPECEGYTTGGWVV